VNKLITDVPGVRAPGSRGTSLLEPEMARGLIDTLVLSGGSLYAVATGGAGPDVDPYGLTELGTVAACGMYEDAALPYKTSLPDRKSRFGGARQ
jgi:hypothetical protein